MNTEEFRVKIFSLSERLYPMVIRMLGTNENAEDALQEIMIKLWNKRRQLAKHPNINGYVYFLARNYCIDKIREKKPETTDYDIHFGNLKSFSEHEQLEWKELNKIIFEILKKLPEQQSEILLMRDIDGFEFSEIASATKLEIEHVRVLLSRARKQVRIELEKIYCYERVQK